MSIRTLETKPEIKINNLGQIVGAYLNLREKHAIEDEMNSLMDGSGECSHFWLKRMEQEEQEFWNNQPYPYSVVHKEVLSRVSEKWAYYHQI